MSKKKQKKTEEVIIDPRLMLDRSSVVVHVEVIKQVSFLSVHIDSELKCHTRHGCGQGSISAYISYGVSSNMLFFLYKATIECVLRYGIIVWFGSLTVKLRAQIINLVRVSGKIMGTHADN